MVSGCSASFVCDPADGHHPCWVLTEQRVWVGVCSLCGHTEVDTAHFVSELCNQIAADILEARDRLSAEGYQTENFEYCSRIAREFRQVSA